MVRRELLAVRGKDNPSAASNLVHLATLGEHIAGAWASLVRGPATFLIFV